MKLPSFKRLLSSDFEKTFQKLVDQLSLSLNNGIDIIYTALANNLTLRDNLRATIKDVNVIVDANGKPTQTTAFTLDSTARVDLVMVGLALNQTNSSIYPSGGVLVSGVQTTNIYTINNVTGLQANNNYLLRIVAFQL